MGKIQVTPVGGSNDTNPGTGTDNSEFGGATPRPKVALNPIQVAGFNPLTPCDFTEFRVFDEKGCCYKNVVFGQRSESTFTKVPTYENDFSTFFVDYSALISPPGTPASIIITLEKLNFVTPGVWTNIAVLATGDYGIKYDLGKIPCHPTYVGYALNWGGVLFLNQSGCYRVKFTALIRQKIASCLVSEPFKMLSWDCDRAHGTVKLESWITGKIGDINADYRVFDICCIMLYDSIRFPGFLGFEKTEYNETMLEYQTGLLERIRDEAVQKFELRTEPLPKTLHDRIKVYGMMSDKMFISDYNKNNSDYFIKRKHFIKAGGYEPEYYDEKGRRLSKVTVLLKEGVQSVIKSICCSTVQSSGSIG